MSDPTNGAPAYEMLWDCRQCGTAGLLGLTHRYCPGCGAPQDPSWRYFPKDEDKVAVADHTFAGADKVCPACDTPNGAAAGFCMSCGGPLDGAKAAKQLDEVAASEAAGTRKAPKKKVEPPPEPTGSGAGVALGGMFGCGTLFAIAALAVVCFGVLAWFWRSDAEVSLADHRWERTIEVETFKEVDESDWCKSPPAGGRERSRTQKSAGTKQVQDGETCVTKNVDRGDGTFTQRQDCKPKMRSEDVMEPWCTWTVQRWTRTDTKRASGGLDAPLSWPAVTTTGCAQLGCTREGKRETTLEVMLTGGGSSYTCPIDGEDRWRAMQRGSAWRLPVSAVTGQAFCGDLSPR